MPEIIFQSSRLSSTLPKKNPTAHSKGLSSDTARASATTLPVSSTQEPIGHTQKVRSEKGQGRQTSGPPGGRKGHRQGDAAVIQVDGYSQTLSKV